MRLQAAGGDFPQQAALEPVYFLLAVKPAGDPRGGTALSHGVGRWGEKGTEETSRGSPAAKPDSEGAPSSPAAPKTSPVPSGCQRMLRAGTAQGQLQT